VHAGEFARLLSILTGDEDEWLAAGAKEVDDMQAVIKADGGATIGSLLDSPPGADTRKKEDS